MGQAKRLKEVKSNITDNESAKMRTSKGTIQGYNGVAAVDKKHQIIVDAQAFGEGQEHHTLKPILDGIQNRFANTGIDTDVLHGGAIVTADTGFSNDANNDYLKRNAIEAYIPDNQFRARDKQFNNQKDKHGKRHRDILVGIKKVIPSSKFEFNTKKKTCRCPMGNEMWLHSEGPTKDGKTKLFFEGKLTDCRYCPIKAQCMRNPSSADTRKGHGRQVSITFTNGRTGTDWMKRRVDSKKGKAKVQGQWQLYCLKNVDLIVMKCMLESKETRL